MLFKGALDGKALGLIPLLLVMLGQVALCGFH